MSGTMAVHDCRLLGTVNPNAAQNIYEVDSYTPTAHIFDWISYYAWTQNGLDTLYILCHGINTLTSDGAKYGGYGLQLGKDDVTPNNADVFYRLNAPNGAGMISQIILPCCGIASVNQYNNGQMFCKALAKVAQCIVIASDTEQLYYGGPNAFGFSVGYINFSSWEGNVYQFNPDLSVTYLSDPPTL